MSLKRIKLYYQKAGYINPPPLQTEFQRFSRKKWGGGLVTRILFLLRISKVNFFFGKSYCFWTKFSSLEFPLMNWKAKIFSHLRRVNFLKGFTIGVHSGRAFRIKAHIGIFVKTFHFLNMIKVCKIFSWVWTKTKSIF